MLAKAFVDNAKVMAKGQITIPKDVRDALGVASGDRVTFIVEGNTVRMVNSAVYAMQVLQQEQGQKRQLPEQELLQRFEPEPEQRWQTDEKY